MGFQQIPKSGFTCIDPTDDNALINTYSTGTSFGDKAMTIRIGFEICQRATQPNVTCMDFEKIKKWAQDNQFALDWIRPETKINIHEKDFKEVNLRFLNQPHSLKLGRNIVKRSQLRKYEVTQADSLIIFESIGERYDEYWNLEDTWTWWDSNVDNARTRLMHEIVLADDKQITKKTNMDLIQLVEKTGGFHDGLVLVFRAVVAPYAATQFLKDFLKDAFKDTNQS